MALDVQALNPTPVQSAPVTTISVTQMLRPQIIGGKVGVSVQDFSVFTQFKHITPLPVSGDAPGYSASRLRLLDTLIDRLIKLKESSVDSSDYENAAGMSNAAIDALIDQYATRYQNISARSAESLTRAEGSNFGISEGENALFLNLLV
jgi:hypothetical protein